MWGDEPELLALVLASESENPDFYWRDQFQSPDGSRIALGIATWHFDGHVDLPGDILANE